MHLKETLSKSSGVVSLTLALGSVPGTHWISDIQPSTQGFWYCSSPGGSVVLKASGHLGLPKSSDIASPHHPGVPGTFLGQK